MGLITSRSVEEALLNSCLVVAEAGNARFRALLQARFAALARFYEPLIGAGQSSSPWFRFLESGAILVGEIPLGRPASSSYECLVWGEALEEHLDSPPVLLAASDGDLRAIDGVTVAVAADRNRARLVAGAACLTTLYTGGSQETRAWSTHAVAAAWMGTGTAQIDLEALPELMAMEFVGGDRTLIDGARAVPPASCIDVSPRGTTERSFWTARDRWEPVSEGEAQDLAESALLSSLSRRLSGQRGPFVGLTAGSDSRVVAIAMKELGIDFESFTWGEPEWYDSIQAAEVAAEIDVAHRVQQPEYLDDEAALTRVRRDVRWNEGTLSVGFVHPVWPPEMTAFVSGTGAETGRAAYPVYFLRLESVPSTAETHVVAQRLSDLVDRRLPFSGKQMRRDLRRRVERWVFEAEQLGYRGWRTLDVVYAEQRVRRWARSYLPLSNFSVVPSFTNPDVLRALAGLPLNDRLYDGFHREFIRKRRPSLVPDPSPHPSLARVRKRPALRRTAMRLGARITGRNGLQQDWLLSQGWTTRPRFREWIADEVLTWPKYEDAIGARWLSGIREGFLRDEDVATKTALLAAAPVALASALDDLHRPGGSTAVREFRGEGEPKGLVSSGPGTPGRG